MKIYLVALVLALACKRAEPVVLTPDSAGTSSTVDTSSGRAASPQSPASRSCGISGQAILTDEGIGELRIGRPADDVKQVCDVVTDGQQQGPEGSMERVIALRIAGDIVPATIVNNKVWRVAVTTPRILTVDSLGVDSPLPKIAAMRGAQFHPGEDGVYAFVAGHCALSFRFSLPLRPPQGGQWTAASIARAHADAAVDRVLLTECRK
jgi:hypothetical protein